MPPRPFPYPFRVGTDICNVSRIHRLFVRHGNRSPYLDRFLQRVLTAPERAYFWHRFGPKSDVFTKFTAMSEFLAGRFAAKEAIRKACDHFHDTTRGFHNIIILPIALSPRNQHQSARPQGLILDTAYPQTTAVEERQAEVQGSEEIFMRRVSTNIDDLEGQLCEISISHDGDFASAVALVPSMREVAVSQQKQNTTLNAF